MSYILEIKQGEIGHRLNRLKIVWISLSARHSSSKHAECSSGFLKISDDEGRANASRSDQRRICTSRFSDSVTSESCITSLLLVRVIYFERSLNLTRN